MKFGLIKSKIENLLIECYNDKNKFKEEMKFFKKYILENKNITKLYFLYDELNSKKGIDVSIVDDYINECYSEYKNTIKNISKNEINNITRWLTNVISENKYHNIDTLFSDNILMLEDKIQAKKIIRNNLTITENKNKKDIIKLPISTMLNVANKTINNHINSLSESDKKKFIDLVSADDEILQKEFKTIKEDVLGKLNTIKENADEDTSAKIVETLDKISKEKYDKLNYFRLKNLNENL